jgi:hypothetical protein
MLRILHKELLFETINTPQTSITTQVGELHSLPKAEEIFLQNDQQDATVQDNQKQ